MAVILAFSLLSVIGSVILFRVFFPRAPMDELNIEYRYSAAADRYDRTRVTFLSGKNELVGYIYGEENTLGLIVIAGGINSDAERHFAETMYFVDRGWRVFAYDETGVRDSEGKGVVGLSQPLRDLEAALDFAKDSPLLSGIPTVIYGHSAGGYAALTLLDRPDVLGAVCLSAFRSPVQTMYRTALRYVGPLATVEYPFLRLQNRLTFGKDADLDAVECLNETEKPALIFNGSYDELLPEEIGMYAHRALVTNPNAVFRCFEDNHSTIWLTDAAEEYGEQLEEEFEALSDRYRGHIPPDVYEEFTSSIDFDRANELDLAVMEEIEGFFRKLAEN